MANQIIPPTFKAIDHSGQKQMAMGEWNGKDFSEILEMNIRVIEFLGHQKPLDLSIIEEKIDDLCSVLREQKPAPIIVKSTDPIIQQQEAPVVNVSSPSVKVEPKNQVIVTINPLWMLLATVIPTIAILIDIYFRAKGR